MVSGHQLNGIIVIDKPANISSAGVVRFVKKTLNAAKVGHAGTLDPFAEGVLICCLNQATRLAGYLLHGKKKYAAVLKLGEETDTQDFTGTIVSTGKPVDFSPQTIQNVFNKCERRIHHFFSLRRSLQDPHPLIITREQRARLRPEPTALAPVVRQ